jgi:lysophospholipase L1-like esterase
MGDWQRDAGPGTRKEDSIFTHPMLGLASIFRPWLLLTLSALILGAAPPGGKSSPAPLPAAEPLGLPKPLATLPTVWIAGDSTAAKGSPTATGWGVPLATLLDARQVNLINGARGGRSSRTFITEGLWERLRAELKPGDWVLIQFGHNDAGPVNDDSRARGSLRSLGEETEVIQNQLTGQPETVHSYGCYLRKMITETKAKGATPVVLGITVRNEWKDGKVERRNGPWTEMAKATAKATNTLFINLTELIADAYDKMGPGPVKMFFPKDHTHTGPDGAALSARLLATALGELGMPGLPAATRP